MQKIIEELLYHTTDSPEESLEDVSVSDMVNEIFSENRITMKEKDITAVCESDKVIEGTYPGKLKRILENIISNSIVHGSSHSTLRVSDRDGGIDITNTDASIDEKILDSIFQPFVTSGKGKKSSGLGLYIARKLGRELGIEITVENHGKDVRTHLEFKDKD